MLGFAANLVSIPEKRIFGRIFGETPLLRIVQTNHDGIRVWGGSTSCCPPPNIDDSSICYRIHSPFHSFLNLENVLNIPNAFLPFEEFVFQYLYFSKQKTTAEPRDASSYLMAEWWGVSRYLPPVFLWWLACPGSSSFPSRSKCIRGNFTNASSEHFHFRGRRHGVSAGVTVSLVARVVNHGYTRRLHILARLLVPYADISGTRGSWLRLVSRLSLQEEKSTFPRIENTK